MATQSETHTSSPPPQPNTGSGVLHRLLHRTKSKKDRTAPLDKSRSPRGSKTQYPEFEAPSAQAPPPQPQANRGPPLAALKPEQRGATNDRQHRAEPMLKKKASMRDRFRSLAKDNPTSEPQLVPPPAREKQRAAYVPTHAAADFSRVGLIPRPLSRQGSIQRYSYERPGVILEHAPQPQSVTAAQVTEDEIQPSPRHYSQRGLQTLAENEPVHPEQQQVAGGALHLLTPGEIHQQRLGRLGHSPSGTAATSPTLPPALPVSVTNASEHDKAHDLQQASDYELFLARAEERERAYREDLLRKLSQRQHPTALETSAPRTSGTYTADSTVVADMSGASIPRKGWESRGGEGSKHLHPGEHERGSRKHASWTPSFGAGAGRDAERKVEREADDVVPELADRVSRPEEAFQGAYTMSPRGSDASVAYTAQQPRTLSRKASFKQRLAGYIKPARPHSRYGDQGLV